jgi:hypothetical protein
MRRVLRVCMQGPRFFPILFPHSPQKILHGTSRPLVAARQAGGCSAKAAAALEWRLPPGVSFVFTLIVPRHDPGSSCSWPAGVNNGPIMTARRTPLSSLEDPPT